MPGPIVSGVASLLIPGLGQLLNRKFVRGGLLLGAWLLTSLIVTVVALPLVILLHLVFILSSGIDAYRIGKSTASGL